MKINKVRKKLLNFIAATPWWIYSMFSLMCFATAILTPFTKESSASILSLCSAGGVFAFHAFAATDDKGDE